MPALKLGFAKGRPKNGKFEAPTGSVVLLSADALINLVTAIASKQTEGLSPYYWIVKVP